MPSAAYLAARKKAEQVAIRNERQSGNGGGYTEGSSREEWIRQAMSDFKEPAAPMPAAATPAPQPAPAAAPAAAPGPAVQALQRVGESAPIDPGVGWENAATPGMVRPGLGERLANTRRTFFAGRVY